jgi:hypothetical protein
MLDSLFGHVCAGGVAHTLHLGLPSWEEGEEILRRPIGIGALQGGHDVVACQVQDWRLGAEVALHLAVDVMSFEDHLTVALQRVDAVLEHLAVTMERDHLRVGEASEGNGTKLRKRTNRNSRRR